MECDHPKPIIPFEELAIKCEYTSPSAAKMAFDRAVEKLAVYLEKEGVIQVLTFRRLQETKENKKVAIAVYEYQADNDGDWATLFWEIRVNPDDNLFARRTIDSSFL